ncbi:hypothetical protein [Segetibacter aerophilus]|uniref:Uncharacterized protein n=1 Tax=Segetibacter aerophilus TaxID=670293 RepID=A0A512BA15_9BACT|nr:hypothetical protein [Segetibacter aerophilus]GEO08779.1 hypothetical protein SAE01_12750 [Segetibacter aerophilus]
MIKNIVFLLLLLSATAEAQKKSGSKPTVKSSVALSGAYAKRSDLVEYVKAEDLKSYLDSSLVDVVTADTLENYLQVSTANKSFASTIHIHKDYFSKQIVFAPVQRGSYTLTAQDDGRWIDIDCPKKCTVILPSPALFKPGTQITISNIGGTRVEFSPVPGVRILTEGNAIALTGLNAIATIVVKNADTYQIAGSITP